MLFFHRNIFLVLSLFLPTQKHILQQYYASGPTDAEASKLIVEWTNQHGCGGNKDSPHKTNCNIVIQVSIE